MAVQILAWDDRATSEPFGRRGLFVFAPLYCESISKKSGFEVGEDKQPARCWHWVGPPLTDEGSDGLSACIALLGE